MPDLLERKTESRWGYDTRLKYYLYRIGMLGNEGVEFLDNFPVRIELNDSWHNTLDRMRKESSDGFERGIPVGYQVDKGSVHLPQEFVMGSRNSVHTLSAWEAKEKYSLENHFGNIHSHPTDRIIRIQWNLLETTGLVKGEGLSLGDFFSMVNGHGLPLMAVSQRNYNYFTFRTKETVDIPKDSPLSSKKAFKHFWNNKFKMWEPVEHMVVPFKLPVYYDKMNIELAKVYNLALYRGKPNDDLVREYP